MAVSLALAQSSPSASTMQTPVLEPEVSPVSPASPLAQNDGLTSVRGSSPRASSPSMAELEAPMADDAPLRRGKWTKEEEEFAAHLIDEFQKGFLNIKQFTTLRSYLADELHCQTMRLSKKYHGKTAIGLQMYSVMNPAMRALPEVVAAIEKSKARRDVLRVRFLKSLHRMNLLMSLTAAAYDAHKTVPPKPLPAPAPAPTVTLRSATGASTAKALAHPSSPPTAAHRFVNNNGGSMIHAPAPLRPSASSGSPTAMHNASKMGAMVSPSHPVPPVSFTPASVATAPVSLMMASHSAVPPVSVPSMSMMPPMMGGSTPPTSTGSSSMPVMYVPMMVTTNSYGTFLTPLDRNSGIPSMPMMPMQGMQSGPGQVWNPMMPMQHQAQFMPMMHHGAGLLQQQQQHMNTASYTM